MGFIENYIESILANDLGNTIISQRISKTSRWPFGMSYLSCFYFNLDFILIQTLKCFQALQDNVDFFS